LIYRTGDFELFTNFPRLKVANLLKIEHHHSNGYFYRRSLDQFY
jgi:hypothetical protein